jgi:hypothetical protein
MCDYSLFGTVDKLKFRISLETMLNGRIHPQRLCSGHVIGIVKIENKTTHRQDPLGVFPVCMRIEFQAQLWHIPTQFVNTLVDVELDFGDIR